MLRTSKICASLALMMAVSGSAYSSVIDFETFTGPSFFSLASPSPQTLNITVDGVTATFTNGVILTATSAMPANQTSVYGTAYFGTGLSNPLKINFDTPVDNILLDVLNGLTTTRSFKVTSSAGPTQTFSLPSNLSSGAATIGLIADDITAIEVLDIGTDQQWDFFVDNIRFNVAAVCNDVSCRETTVPEPTALALFGLGLAGLAMSRRRKSR